MKLLEKKRLVCFVFEIILLHHSMLSCILFLCNNIITIRNWESPDVVKRQYICPKASEKDLSMYIVPSGKEVGSSASMTELSKCKQKGVGNALLPTLSRPTMEHIGNRGLSMSPS